MCVCVCVGYSDFSKLCIWKLFCVFSSFIAIDITVAYSSMFLDCSIETVKYGSEINSNSLCCLIV